MVIMVAAEKEPTPLRASLAAAFEDLESRFLRLAAEDERAFSEVMDALRIPRNDAARPQRLETAFERAADVPLQAADAVASVLELLEQAEPHASRAIVSDVGAAAHLALASLHSSTLNVAVNVRSLNDPAVCGRLRAATARLQTAAETAHARLVRRVEDRLAAPRS
jgi:formiminotetrahydrofolate cyclodeaminase